MRRWCFNILMEFDTQALLNVLQLFALLGLRSQWLLLSEQSEAFAFTAHYDNLNDEVAVQLFARLQQMACVRIAGATLLDAGEPQAPVRMKLH